MLFIFDLKTSKDVISLREPAALSFVGFLKFFVYFFSCIKIPYESLASHT